MNIIITSTNLSGVGWFSRVISQLHKEMFGTTPRWQYEIPKFNVLTKRFPMPKGWLSVWDVKPQKLVERGYDKVICLHLPWEDLLDNWHTFRKRIPIGTRLKMEPRYTNILKKRWQVYEDDHYKHPNYLKLWLPDLNTFTVREFNRVMNFLGWKNIKAHTTIGWCKNFDDAHLMCEAQECGKCMTFEPKKNRPLKY